jgi:hypothetical protein
MARPVSLASLKEQARFRADQVNSGFVSDSELRGYINASLTELYDLLVAAYGDDYYTKTVPQSITSTGAEYYALASDFYKLQGVDLQMDSVNWKTLKPYMFSERNRWGGVGAWNDGGCKYKLMGTNLYLKPVPPVGKVLQVWYVPICPSLAVDADEFDFINGWEEYVIVDVAIKMMVKEESPIGELAAQKQAMRARLDQMKIDRDIGQPMRIADVRGYNNPFDDEGDGCDW